MNQYCCVDKSIISYQVTTILDITFLLIYENVSFHF
jgi:hypothetical protein